MHIKSTKHTFSACLVLGTIVEFIVIKTLDTSQQRLTMGTMVTYLLQMEKLRHKEGPC